MGTTTTKIGLYKPGGGSTGLITPDEPVDVDKFNANSDLIDSFAGIRVCTSTTKPTAHYNGMPIYVTDNIAGARLEVWLDSAGNYVNAVGVAVPDIIVSSTPMTAGAPVNRVRLW